MRESIKKKIKQPEGEQINREQWKRKEIKKKKKKNPQKSEKKKKRWLK